MPDTPMSDSAARTSSSLKGLMIAVTSLMRGTLRGAGVRREGILQLSCHAPDEAKPRKLRLAPGRRRGALHCSGARRLSLHPALLRTGVLGIGYSSGELTGAS